MKFKFSKNLDYQLEAIDSIVDIFDSGENIFGHEVLTKKESGALFENVKVIRNVLEIDQKRIIKNVHAIQKSNGLELSEISTHGGIGVSSIGTEMIGGGGGGASRLKSGMDFSIEMETGTGKTYVYLRTILELNKKYGLKKVIILVPSVAIREGVLKTLEQTRQHFKDLYDTNYGYFAYDSKKLSKVREFSQSLDVQIMVMTIQSFNSDDRVMRQTPDRFNGESPLELVSATKPIVIMDEPQNMESELSKSAIADLKPLCKLRYSATHKDKKNLMYQLTPVDAYKKGLVKKIEVFGVDDRESSDFIFKVREIVKTQPLKARVALEVKSVSGEFSVKDVILGAGSDLKRKAKNDKYGDLFINEIDARIGKVELSDGKIFKVEEDGNENKEAIFRTQIRETIKAHLSKQDELGDQIKVLSLFFIDRVENYVSEDGLIRKIFVEEFEKLKNNSEFFKDKETVSVHNGYFANTKSKGQIIYKNTTGKTQADKEVYDLIMKKKEKLLSFSEPIWFIFSHSALKEGWDNPNVFQICTLNETTSGMKKRQEIGRGMRLAVNIEGDRIFDSKINILTVVPNESYKEFVGGLQRDYSDAGFSDVPQTSNAREKMKIKFKYEKNKLPEDFDNLWKKIQKRTKFNIELKEQDLIEKSIEKINELDVQRLVINVDKVMIDFADGGKLKTIYETASIGERLKKDIRIGNIIDKIAGGVGVTKSTIFRILSEVENLDFIFENPEEYLRSTIMIIKNSLNDLLINEGLKYSPIDDVWEISLFEDLEGYESKSTTSEKSAYERVVWESAGEMEFAKNLDLNPNVKMFVKLPPRFVVDTPLGTYNPDWAIVMNTDDGEKLYLVRETKFGMELENLRPSEKQKILCGEKHFAAIGVDFKVSQKKDLGDLN